MSPSSSKSQTLSPEDAAALIALFDKDGNKTLSKEELEQMVKDYNENKINDPRVLVILSKYDSDNDGKIDIHEAAHLAHQLSIQETAARYVGYSAVYARAFRYLAFTSDFGEALRPVVHKRIVNATYAVAFGYCFADIGYEAYKLHNRGYVTEKNEPMTMTQCVVERTTFQAIASITLPAVIIHTTVDVAKHATKRIGRFTKWGPSIIGLSVIPLLPLFIDEPVEKGLEYIFENYGPWAHHNKSHKD
eukprot:gene13458-18052_t